MGVIQHSWMQAILILPSLRNEKIALLFIKSKFKKLKHRGRKIMAMFIWEWSIRFSIMKPIGVWSRTVTQPQWSIFYILIAGDKFYKGKTAYLTHSANVNEVLAQYLQQSGINQDDALLHMRAAGILYGHVLVKQDSFIGTPPSNCFSRHFPEPLLTFIDVWLQGSNASLEGPQENDAGMDRRSKVTCGLCQLITYGMVKDTSSSITAVLMWPRRGRQTPFPLYIKIKNA